MEVVAMVVAVIPPLSVLMTLLCSLRCLDWEGLIVLTARFRCLLDVLIPTGHQTFPHCLHREWRVAHTTTNERCRPSDEKAFLDDGA